MFRLLTGRIWMDMRSGTEISMAGGAMSKNLVISILSAHHIHPTPLVGM